MRFYTHATLWVLLVTGFVSASLQEKLKSEYNGEQLDTLVRRIEQSNATFTTKELYKFTVLTTSKGFLKGMALEESLRSLTCRIEENLAAFSMLTEGGIGQVADVIADQQIYLSTSAHLQELLQKYEMQKYNPIYWLYVKPLRPMLQTYISHLDRTLQKASQSFLITRNESVHLRDLSRAVKRAKSLSMSSESVLATVEQMGIHDFLRLNAFQSNVVPGDIDAGPDSEIDSDDDFYSHPNIDTDTDMDTDADTETETETGVDADEERGSQYEDESAEPCDYCSDFLGRVQSSNLRSTFTTAYFMVYMIGASIIVPMMCTTPGIMMAQCVMMVSAFTGLHMVTIAAYISYLKEEFSLSS